MKRPFSPWIDEPILAACGLSGSGKTTLVEAAIRVLVARGLAVAAVKHDAHGLQLDLPHKDSGRLFAAGADVGLSGPGEEVQRSHRDGPPDLDAMLRRLLASHDVVLVEGHKATPLPKVWLPTAEAPAPSPEVTAVVATLPMDDRREKAFLELVTARIERAQVARPLRGGLLVGGASRRMGRPKQLVEIRGRPLLDVVAKGLGPQLEDLVLLGGGAVPDGWDAVPRLADPPGLAGPLAGMLAAMRWAPRSAWLIAPCDLPSVNPEAVEWLLGERRPGRWAVLPELEAGRVEPLLAFYEPQAGPLLEALAAAGCRAPRVLADHPRVHRPLVPGVLRDAWCNVNTPQELNDCLIDS